MENLDYDEQEYKRFMVELSSKVTEITKEYNKLSDKNKYRLYLFLEQILWTSIALRKW